MESLSPHRLLAVDENDELIDKVAEPSTVDYGETRDFAAIMLENLRMSGVQQARKSDRITFSSVTGWPGTYICAEGHYQDRNRSRRAGIMIGPEFGTVSRPDLAAAAREAAEFRFDTLIACAFSYDAACSDLDKLGRMRVLKARMNADLHMATDLKQTEAGTSSSSSASPTSGSTTSPTMRSRSRSAASTSSTPARARSGATMWTESPAGSSTRTTTRRVSSFGTLTSWARGIPTRV